MAVPDELTRFVREALAAGRSRADIAATLREAGWPADQVEPALNAFADLDYPVPVPRPAPYLSAREAFWYLVLFTTLYLWAFSLGALLFDLIEVGLPDPTDSRYALRYRTAGMRWSIAVLVIAFPTYLFMARLIGRALAQEPDKRTSKVRKWLTYLTLFVTVCILVGDLVALVYNFLSGDLTLRFLLKVLVVGALAGGVLAYYLWDLRRDEVEHTARRGPTRGLALAVSLGVGAAVAAGFFVIGSPVSARAAELDDLRVQNLRAIESAVVSHYQDGDGTLPASLDALDAFRYNQEALRDPVSEEPYAYTALSDSTFELCATFDAVADAEAYVPPSTEVVQEGTGRQCFEIDATSGTD